MDKISPFSPDLLLIDGSSYLYRAYYALPPLTNSKGLPTGAIYGVMNMIKKLIKDYNSHNLAVIFDPPGPTFRDKIFAHYKAHRPPMPSDLVRQIEPLQQLIRAQGVPLIIIEGVEADDVIATIALQAKKEGKKTLISTGDKDMAQLVCPEIILINTMSNTLLDRAGVQNKFGITPEQIIDYLALVGDSVDNIPGIPQVGPKTAAKWLNEYHNLDRLIAQASEIKGKVGENLRNNLDQLYLARELATLKEDVALPFTPTDLTCSPPDKLSLVELLQNLEFKTWLAEVGGEPAQKVQVSQEYTTLLDKDALTQTLQQLAQAKQFALTIITDTQDAISANLIGIAFSSRAGTGVYIPLGHHTVEATSQLDREEVLLALQPLLSDPHNTVIGQNLKYAINVLAQYDFVITAACYDTMLESYVLNPSVSRHDLETLSLKHLHHQTITLDEIAGKGAKQITVDQVDIATATQYAAEAADMTLRLHQLFWPELQKTQGLKQVFQEIEMPLLPVLAQMEHTGVLIDAQKLQAQSIRITEKIADLEQEAFRLVGHEFNLASPKQLQQILFEELNLPSVQKTPTGQPSTAESALQELAETYPLPKLILEHRGLAKLKSTYTDKLPLQINPHTGRVHTSYQQAITATGRLSSIDPNLQNIPIKTEEGRLIRQAFIARPGYQIAAIDYSQIELRIMAHMTDDPGLMKAFRNDWDIHTATASEVFGMPLAEVTPVQRRHAKAINFGLIYGMSAFGLAKQLDIGRLDAEKYIEVYFHRYPNVAAYMNSIRQSAHELGYVETLFGRRLYLPEIQSKNMMRRRAAERAAINAPLQGTAADIIKYAMIKIAAFLVPYRDDAAMIMQVHDELVFEIKTELSPQLVPELAQQMQSAADLKVKLVAHSGIGNNWDEAH